MQVYAEIWVDSLDPAKVAQAGDQLRWLDELAGPAATTGGLRWGGAG